MKLPEINNTLILFHYPIYEWDGCHKGWYHLHGHIHDRVAEIQGRILNVGWDLHGRFLTVQDIHQLLENLPVKSHFGEKSKQFPLPDVHANQTFLRQKMEIING